MNRKVKFLGCFFVLLALVAYYFVGKVNAFPTHDGTLLLGDHFVD